MDKHEVFSVMLAFLVALLSLLVTGVHSGAFQSRPQQVSREDCIKQAAIYFGSIEVDDEMMARLEYARKFYFQEHYGERHVRPELSMGCKRLQDRHSKLLLAVPCFGDPSVMGGSSLEAIMQAYRDIIKISEQSRFALELGFACGDGRGAGESMRHDLAFEAITGQSADRALVRKATRDECIEQAVNFFNQIDTSDVKARLMDAQKFYFKNIDKFTYIVPEPPEACAILDDELRLFDNVVPCYEDKSVMGESRMKNFADVLEKTQKIRQVFEAWYACKGARLAGQMLKRSGIFMATLGMIKM